MLLAGRIIEQLSWLASEANRMSSNSLPVDGPQDQRTIRVDETSQEAAYRTAISVHCPGRDEMEMAARIDIAMMRDAATVGMSRASDSAVVLLGEVSRLAAIAVYASAPASRLIRIRAALGLTMEAARALERVQRNG